MGNEKKGEACETKERYSEEERYSIKRRKLEDELRRRF